MHIDRYNHLQFPRENPSNAAGGKDAPAPSVGAAGTPAQATGLLQVDPDTAPQRADSVVLQIRWPDAAPARPETALYTAARKAGAAAAAAEEDAADQAQAYQRAMDRQGVNPARLSVNKDGLLEARPASADAARQPDFVSVAVSAMRELRDQAERDQAAQTAATATSAPSSGWSLHSLAARFKAFA
jgi:hypothetical protein